MGIWMPPYYGVESLEQKIEKLEKVTHKMYELSIEAEDIINEIKKTNSVKD